MAQEDIYLTEVELINFQSHLHTKMKFVNGFNLLAGTSNSGKSATMRGIIWNILNEPSGDEYISKFASEAAVITHWSNGYSIERRKNRGGSKNFYILYKNGEKISEYTGFGTSVPKEITEAHGIVPLASGVYFNYANQLESAFMISNTPKVRAETIGNLEELGRIDEELININADINADRKERKRLDKEVADLEKEINSLEQKVSLNEQKISTLKMLKESIEAQTTISFNVEKYYNRLIEINSEIHNYSTAIEQSIRILEEWDELLPEKIISIKQLISATTRLSEIQDELRNIGFMNENALEELNQLSSFVSGAADSFQNIKLLVNRLEEIQQSKSRIESGISHKVAALDFSVLDKDVERFKFLFKESGRLREIGNDISKNKETVEQSTEQIEKLLHQFVHALQSEHICPTCSQSTENLTTNDIEKIV